MLKKPRISSSSKARRNQLIGVASKSPRHDTHLPRTPGRTSHLDARVSGEVDVVAWRTMNSRVEARRHPGSHVTQRPQPLELRPRVGCLRGRNRSFVALVLSFHRIIMWMCQVAQPSSTPHPAFQLGQRSPERSHRGAFPLASAPAACKELLPSVRRFRLAYLETPSDHIPFKNR
jgi:hypothetical protein